MGGVLNINDMAASAFNIIEELSRVATNFVGLDSLYCRATPQINSEDIVLQEYTLTNLGLECPKMIKVLTSNADYNPGNFTVDLFGVNYEATLEINIPISNRNDVFGANTLP